MNIGESNKHQTVPGDWYAAAFGALYPVVYAHRTVEAAIPEARFAAKALSLTEADNALDLCCGTGRHLVALETTGAALTGADYSRELLLLASRQVSRATKLVRADMRRLPFHIPFDAVFSFFTSFGYFIDDSDNRRSACELGRILKPGGRFFMDYLNPEALDGRLVPQSERTVRNHTILERRWIDDAARRINKETEVWTDGQCIGSSVESVRLYRFSEMRDMLLDGGLQVTECWGDYAGTSYDKDSPRMILAGVKKSIP